MWVTKIIAIFTSMAKTPSKYKKSCSHERLAQLYLTPKTHMMFKADAKNKIRSESSIGDEIISRHYASLPPQTQKALLEDYERYFNNK